MKKINLSQYFDEKNIEIISQAQPGDEFEVVGSLLWQEMGIKNSILGNQGDAIIAIDDKKIQRTLTILDLKKVDESDHRYKVEVLFKFKR